MKKTVALTLAIMTTAALHAVTAAFPYQGRLLDVDGNPLTGPQNILVRLYTTVSGSTGDALWGRTYAVQLADTGLFNLEISDNTGSAIDGVPAPTLESVICGNETLYIGIFRIGSSGEIKPRQKLLAVPYATCATNVKKASGDFEVSGTLTAERATFSGQVGVGTLNVSGVAGAGSLNVAGGATVGGNLRVAGAINGFGVAPVGCIIMWSGTPTEIPGGWALCNGQTAEGLTTPDLRDRFIVGAGNGYAVGAQGGEAAHTLTVEEMPSHNHSYSFKGADLDAGWKKQNNFYSQANRYGDLDNTAWTSSVGGGLAHENRPPYYALCFIMRVK